MAATEVREVEWTISDYSALLEPPDILSIALGRLQVIVVSCVDQLAKTMVFSFRTFLAALSCLAEDKITIHHEARPAHVRSTWRLNLFPTILPLRLLKPWFASTKELPQGSVHHVTQLRGWGSSEHAACGPGV